MFKLMLLLLEPVLLLHPSVLLLQLHLLVLHLLQDRVGTIRSMKIKLRTVGNPVWSWKTSSPAGGAPLPTCRFLRVESWY